MNTDDKIREFLGEQLEHASGNTLYNEKKMLKNGNYRAFAEEQLKKSRKSLLAYSPMVLMGSWFSIKHLIKYGSSSHWFDLVMGLSCWILLLLFCVISAREFYTRKRSFVLLQNLMDKIEGNRTISDDPVKQS